MENDLRPLFSMLALVTFVRVIYEISRAQKKPPEVISELPETHPEEEVPQSTSLSLRQNQWKEKAVKRYAASQEKQWRKWNEVMFEPKKGGHR